MDHNSSFANMTTALFNFTNETFISTTTPTTVTDATVYLNTEFRRSVDDFFLLMNAIIICLMQSGFAYLETGSVRAKNATNIMMKNMLDMFICGIVYWLIGYSLAFAGGSPFMGLGTYVIGIGMTSNKVFSHWFFQFTFAATASTIISGAVAERCSFIAYLVYSAIVSAVVYPIVTHWAWHPEGWLYILGFVDFAGSGVVHVVGGSCSLVGAAILGPRLGRFNNKGLDEYPDYSKDFSGHSTPYVGLGGMILFIGFLAFNGGSLGHISQPGDGEKVGLVMANTALGGAGGALSTMLIYRVGILCTGGEAKWSFLASLNGGLIGMVCVCASADTLQMWAAILMGLVSGPIYCTLSYLVAKVKIDDPLDAIAVHLGGGTWGLLGGALLRADALPSGNTRSAGYFFGYNIIGLIAIMTWACGISIILFGGLRLLGLLRVSAEEEIKGMDSTKHLEPAYPGPAWHVMESGQDKTSIQLDTDKINGSIASTMPDGRFDNLAYVHSG